jgi:hypothetical protein
MTLKSTLGIALGLLCALALAPAFATEDSPETTMAPEMPLDFPALTEEPQFVSTQCSATVDCKDGTSITCTSCETGAQACNATPRSCPASRGSVSCKVGFFTVTTVCDEPCPPTYCPDEPACNYQYHFATGCCEPNDPTPGYYCPQVCE